MTKLFHSHNRGFTLIEVIVAITILGFGIVTIAQVISGGLRSTDISRKYVSAVTIAQSKLAELSMGGIFKEGSEKGTWSDESNEERYQWETVVTPFREDEDGNVILYKVLVRVLPDDSKKEKWLELSTLRIKTANDNT